MTTTQPSTTDFTPAYRRIAECIAAQRQKPSDAPLRAIRTALAVLTEYDATREVDLVALHADYENLCHRTHNQPLTIDVFARQVTNLGFGLVERGGYVLVTGLRPAGAN